MSEKEKNEAPAISDTPTAEPEIDRPIMLYKVLLQEYAALGLIDGSDVDEVKAFKTERDKQYGVLHISERNKLPPAERADQLELAQKARSEVLARVREVLHRASTSRFDEIYSRNKKAFASKTSDTAEADAAAGLATILEIKRGTPTTEGDLKAILADARSMLSDEKLPLGELKQRETELKALRDDEVSNSVTALCLSGGGIRSATFCLGVVQALAANGLLDKFHYLSSVSGGGYIASWLSAWIYRRRIENEKMLVESGMAPPAEPPVDFDVGSISEIQDALNYHKADLPEPAEITHLRKYSNYMSPSVGLFSTDTWALIAVYFRNLLLNWTVIIPWIVAILLIPVLLAFVLGLRAGTSIAAVVGAVSALGALVGIGCINMMRPSLKNYSPFQQVYTTDDIGSIKASNKVALLCLLPVLVFAFGLATYWSWAREAAAAVPLLDFIYFGIAIFFGGYLLGWVVMLPKFIHYWSKESRAERASRGEDILQATDPERSGWGWLYHKFKTYVAEPLLSTICGAFGGLLLYVVVVKIFPIESGSIMGIDASRFLLAFGVPLILNVFLLAATLFTGLAVGITNDDDREWVTRFGALLLKVSVAWAVLASAVLFGPLIFGLKIFGFSSGSIQSLVGAIVTLAGILSTLSGFSGKTPANSTDPPKDRSGLLITLASSIAAPICVLFLAILIAFGSQQLVLWAASSINGGDEARILAVTPLYQLMLFGLAAAVGSVMGLFININKFSFHSTYRERLIRAYLGASNRSRRLQANSFTGLDTESDNVAMKDLRQKPLHVVNMTLNMVKADNLAWQNRKAESFTATALHSGSSQMGGSGNYRRSDLYGANKQNNRAITLGTSAAISGAAVSPNMGYFTQSTAVSFLMVLLNVRLGWWLGNPGQRGDIRSAWKKSAPFWSPLAFLSEALERTDDTHPYVYLADGGQFENLGLYEMVLRRCKTIVVCDAGADPKPAFYDLGSAIHKIRVDMGIPIDFEKTPESGKYGAIASIRYSAVDGPGVDDGRLIYIKPTLNQTESIDVQHYHNENPTFPHETTADQFYSETQFESYRSLGFNIMESLCRGEKLKDLGDLVANAKRNLSATVPDVQGGQ